jgi:hypothetical protein
MSAVPYAITWQDIVDVGSIIGWDRTLAVTELWTMNDRVRTGIKPSLSPDTRIPAEWFLIAIAIIGADEVAFAAARVHVGLGQIVRDLARSRQPQDRTS